jgi:hypothetical protein
MPTVWNDGKYRKFFYSDEGSEPPHLHIESAERRAKYWLDPIDLVWNDGFRSGELKEIVRILVENQAAFLRAWNDYFGI